MEVKNYEQKSVDHPRYLIPEKTYRHDHPEVIFWTKYFMDKAAETPVFTKIEESVGNSRTLSSATAMAKAWYAFTRYVPRFITKAVAQIEDPEIQHHLIQIAYDELGGTRVEHIHSKLFQSALAKAQIELVTSECGSPIDCVINSLDDVLVRTKSQHGVVGLLLSFEILAQENVEMLYKNLCYDATIEVILNETPFFKIHRADEIEHIRHSIANFLRFCSSEQAREEFLGSFVEGVEFWYRFWNQCAYLIESSKPQKHNPVIKRA